MLQKYTFILKKQIFWHFFSHFTYIFLSKLSKTFQIHYSWQQEKQNRTQREFDDLLLLDEL